MTDEQQWPPRSPGISFDKPQNRPADAPPAGYGVAPPAGHGGYAQPGYGAPGYPQPGYGAPGYGPPPYGGAPGYGPYGYRPGPPPGPKPSNNIGWAIAAIFLFWPLCIPAFIFSGRVDSAWFAGDYAGAQKASHDARLYGLIGVCIGGALALLYVLFFVIVLAAVTTS